MTNNFFLISYPQGAAGRFLCSILGASKSVAHFDSTIEENKSYDKCLSYIVKRFVPDMSKWLANEPKHTEAWNLHFVSTKYARGDDLSLNEFVSLCEAHGTTHFKESVAQNKLILFPWCKTNIPAFFNNTKKITVLLDKLSHNWIDRALWNKHYAIEDNKILNRVHDHRNDPVMLEYYKKFNNPLYSTQPVNEFYQENITNNPDKKLFESSDQFANRVNNISVNLSDILNVNSFVLFIRHVVETHNLDPIDEDFIIAAHLHWSGLHDF